MPQSARKRWAAARALYENYTVPVDLLSDCLGAKPATIEDRIVAKMWSRNTDQSDGFVKAQADRSAMVEKLLKTVSTQVEKFSNGSDDDIFDDKKMRLVSTLASSVEKLTAMHEADLTARQKETERVHEKNEATGKSAIDAYDGTLELRAKLEARINALVAQRSEGVGEQD